MAETIVARLTASKIRLPTTLFMPASARRYSTFLSLLLVAPLLLLLTFSFVYPVGKLVSSSFFNPDFTLAQYARILDEPLYLKVLWRTIRIAFVVTLCSLLLGYPVAYALARLKGAWGIVVMGCVLVPLWTSVLVRSYAWIVLLQRNGIINNTLKDAGLISQPLQLIYTEGAVILAMTHILLPFMILPIYSALRTIPDDLSRAARNLGAGPYAAFARIVLPLSLPGVFAGSLMTFILALGFYITPALVGGASTLLMATLIGQQTTVLLDWPFAGALSTLLLVTTLVLVGVFRKALTLGKSLDNGR